MEPQLLFSSILQLYICKYLTLFIPDKLIAGYLYPYIFTAIDSGISLIPSKVLSESTKIFISRLK